MRSEDEDEDKRNRKNQYISDLPCGNAVVINIVGGQIALMLRLPVYLDSIGTILTGAVLGPWFGMLPNLLRRHFYGNDSGYLLALFCSVGMITGIMSGILLHGETAGKSVKGDGSSSRDWVYPCRVRS